MNDDQIRALAVLRSALNGENPDLLKDADIPTICAWIEAHRIEAFCYPMPTKPKQILKIGFVQFDNSIKVLFLPRAHFVFCKWIWRKPDHTSLPHL